MRISRFGGGIGIGLVCSLAASPAFAQSQEDLVGARAAASAGAKAFNEKHWQESIKLFKKAESIIDAPTQLIYIARAYVHLGKLVKAREVYLRIQRTPLKPHAPAVFAKAKREAEKDLRALEPRLAHVTLSVHGATGGKVTITQDGTTIPGALVGVPLPIDPGDHTFSAKAGTQVAAPVKVHLSEGQSTAVTLKLAAPQPAASPAAAPSDTTKPNSAAAAPPPPSASADQSAEASHGNSTLRYLSFASFGVGALGIAGGIVFTLKGSNKQKDADSLYNQLCSKGCLPAQQAQVTSLDNDASSAKTLGVVGFVVGGVGVVGGITLLLLSNKSSRSSTAASAGLDVRPWIGVGSAGVRGTF